MSEPDPAGDEQPPPRPGSLRPTTARALTIAAVTGLVGGWASHLVVERLTPGRQLSPFAARSRTILPEEDHADELDHQRSAGSSP